MDVTCEHWFITFGVSNHHMPMIGHDHKAVNQNLILLRSYCDRIEKYLVYGFAWPQEKPTFHAATSYQFCTIREYRSCLHDGDLDNFRWKVSSKINPGSNIGFEYRKINPGSNIGFEYRVRISEFMELRLSAFLTPLFFLRTHDLRKIIPLLVVVGTPTSYFHCK